MPEGTSDQDRDRIRNNAYNTLEGKPPAKESPKDFFNSTISPEFNRQAAKEERDGDQPEQGNDEPSGPPDVPPEPPGGGPSAPSGGAAASPSPSDRAEDADAARGTSEQAGTVHSKFLDLSEAPPNHADKDQDAGTAKGSEQASIVPSKFFDASQASRDHAGMDQEAPRQPGPNERDQGPPQQAGAIPSRFLDASKAPPDPADGSQDAGKPKETPEPNGPLPEFPERD
jgi:hypothetical protein